MQLIASHKTTMKTNINQLYDTVLFSRITILKVTLDISGSSIESQGNSWEYPG